MKKEEIELFKQLCNFKSKKIDESLLEYATPIVLGHLFFNRVSAIAYGNLMEQKLLGKVNREFRNSLKSSYDQNIEKNKAFFFCVKYLSNVLSNCGFKYAMLKGAFLCKYYPIGYRTSNDIDILVHPKHVTEIGNILKKADFQQGNIKNGEFIPATRQEIIESKMMRGETVPYIKEINLPGMKYLEVDINFSLDYKNGATDTLEEFLLNSSKVTMDDMNILTLSNYDFFIHLCCHLYKEATTLPWIELNRDMSLYKYCDIYLLLSNMSEKDVYRMFERAAKLGLEDICAFAVIQTLELFDSSNDIAQKKSRDILKTNPDFIHTILSPKDNKVFIYTEKNIFNRLIADKRIELLVEVKNDGKIEDAT